MRFPSLVNNALIAGLLAFALFLTENPLVLLLLPLIFQAPQPMGTEDIKAMSEGGTADAVGPIGFVSDPNGDDD